MSRRWIAPVGSTVAVVALAAGCGSATQAQVRAQRELTSWSQNRTACEYVLAANSLLNRTDLKGSRAPDALRNAAVASSPILRHEESAWQAASDSKNYAVMFHENGALLDTCFRLGLGWTE
jgi:hypothetical protein